MNRTNLSAKPEKPNDRPPQPLPPNPPDPYPVTDPIPDPNLFRDRPNRFLSIRRMLSFKEWLSDL